MQAGGNGIVRDCGRLCRMNVLFRNPGKVGKLSGRRAAMERFRKQEALVKKNREISFEQSSSYGSLL